MHTTRASTQKPFQQLSLLEDEHNVAPGAVDPFKYR